MNNEYLIAALKKEADFHTDLAKEKTTDDDANYHLRKVALFNQCAEALRNTGQERDKALDTALKEAMDICEQGISWAVTANKTERAEALRGAVSAIGCMLTQKKEPK
jgi:hypothetical protein